MHRPVIGHADDLGALAQNRLRLVWIRIAIAPAGCDQRDAGERFPRAFIAAIGAGGQLLDVSEVKLRDGRHSAAQYPPPAIVGLGIGRGAGFGLADGLGFLGMRTSLTKCGALSTHNAMTDSAFKRWRKQLGWTQSQAADALGVTIGYVKSCDAGISRTTKQPVKMSETLRMLMTAIAERGGKVDPWPEA